jgi:hypothetical protein
VSLDVAWRREPDRGISRQIFEKTGKTLKRNGGDNGARTRDLRRDSSAVRNFDCELRDGAKRNPFRVPVADKPLQNPTETP